MIPNWLKPSKIGAALFIVSAILILYIYGYLHLFFFQYGNFSRIYEPWHLGLTLLVLAYPISMVSGRSIEARRKLKEGPAGKKPKAENRLLEWVCFIAFLIIVAIPLDLGCYLLSPASYFRHFALPPRIDSPMPIVFWFAYGFPIAGAIVLKILRWNTAFIISLTSAILLERLFAELSWHSMGEVPSWFYHILIWLNIIPVILYAVKFKRTAAVIMLALALWLVSEQLPLGYRFVQLQDEAHAIVEYIYKTKAHTGSYPEDLSEYKFMNPQYEKHIMAYESGDKDFTLRYYVMTPGTSHWYDSKDGWHYYPD